MPANWTAATLSDITDVVRGITFPATAKESSLTQTNVCCLRTSNIQRKIEWDSVYFIPRNYVKREDQLVQPGDILMSMANSYELVGKVAVADIVPYPTAFGAFLAAIRPTSIVEGKYLFHLLRTNQVQSELREGSSQTTNIANISISKLASIDIPLAPLPEQKRIADKLDAVLARVDACRDRLDRIPSILKRFRQSVLVAATSGKLTEDWRISNATATVWTYHPLGELCSRVSVGHVGETSKHYTTADDGIPFLRSQNVRPGRVALEGLTHITKEFHGKLKKSQLLPGDLLVVRVGANRGDSCILPDGFSEINCANIVFARPKKVLPAYLSIFFQSPSCQEDLLGKSVGGAQGVINTKVVEQIIVSLPPDIEQTEIVRRVESLFACADRLEARYTAARAQVEKLTPATLAKAFRGELVPQDPNDEPASALLARIKATTSSMEKQIKTPRRASAMKSGQ